MKKRFDFGRSDLVLRLYLRLMRPQRTHIFAYFLLLLGTLGLQIPIPFLLSRVVDGLSRSVGFVLLAPSISCIVGLSVTSLIVSVCGQIYSAKLNQRFLLDARLTVFEALQNAPLGFAREFSVSDLHARFGSDMAALNHLLPTGLANAGRHICFLMVFGVILIYLSSTAVLYIFGFLPLAAVVFKYASRRLSVLAGEAHAGHAEASATILESLRGLREGRVTGSHGFHRRRLKLSLERSEEKFFRARRYSALMFGGLGIVPIMVTAMIWTVGGWKVESGELTVGQLMSFMLVLSMLYGPINGLFGVASGYIYELAAFKRIAKLFNEQVLAPSEIALEKAEGALAPDSSRFFQPASLALRDVSFSYGTKPIFDAFNAVIPGGFCTALIGRNGTGKSTLMSIIAGLDSPAAGCVFLNEMPLSALDSGFLSRHYGYLPQDVLIFGDSLRINITMGRDLSDEQIQITLNDLGLGEFLSEWKHGLDTVILESGRDLSGGQIQKIALLRAIINQPTVLILDEPEKNLDQGSLENLVTYLRKLRGRCTVILVTHGAAFQELVDFTLDLSLGNDFERTNTVTEV